MIYLSMRQRFFSGDQMASDRVKPKKHKLSEMERKEEIAGYLFILPNFIGILIFVLFPTICSLLLGFVKWNPMQGLSNMRFAGLENFAGLANDALFTTSLKNNILFTIIYVPFSIVLALIVAGLLNRYVFFKVPIRLMTFMPYISSIVSVAYVWMILYYPSGGPINSILMSLGVQNPPQWLASPKTALISIIIMSIWHDVGYYMIIFLAAMQGISGELYESAAVDGAGGIKSFLKITVPMLGSNIMFVSILATINSFKVFDQVNTMVTDAGPGRSASVLVYAIYYYAFRKQNIGKASAIAVVLFLIIFVISMVQMRLKKKVTV